MLTQALTHRHPGREALSQSLMVLLSGCMSTSGKILPCNYGGPGTGFVPLLASQGSHPGVEGFFGVIHGGVGIEHRAPSRTCSNPLELLQALVNPPQRLSGMGDGHIFRQHQD